MQKKRIDYLDPGVLSRTEGYFLKVDDHVLIFAGVVDTVGLRVVGVSIGTGGAHDDLMSWCWQVGSGIESVFGIVSELNV